MRFANRSDAGKRLATRLAHLRGGDVIVLGLPRGGVAVAAEVARGLHAPLDVILVRKLGVPVQPELGMGAIGEGGARVINPDVVRFARLTEQDIAEVEERERAVLQQRAQRLRGDRPHVTLAGRTAVVVDDGIATGSTARAACQVARAQGARRVVLAVPVAPPASVSLLAQDADEVVCLETPGHFMAIGEWYEDFSQTSEVEVTALLREAAAERSEPGPVHADVQPSPAGQSTQPSPAGQSTPPSPAGVPRDEEVTVAAGGVSLPGHLTIPRPGADMVIFAHGSGSSYQSPRNRLVAGTLHEAGLGTMLFDLLTSDEQRERANVFNIDLLASRLSGATAWLRDRLPGPDIRAGYFGASTGAAAALVAAATRGSDIGAVVSRGGRPDLAVGHLAGVQAPTLLIVGSRDELVLAENHRATQHLHCENHVAVVPGATHLFEEPGTLEQVAELARDWFTRHLAAAHASA
jgi:putative phosphoribosyl transferase